MSKLLGIPLRVCLLSDVGSCKGMCMSITCRWCVFDADSWLVGIYLVFYFASCDTQHTTIFNAGVEIR